MKGRILQTAAGMFLALSLAACSGGGSAAEEAVDSDITEGTIMRETIAGTTTAGADVLFTQITAVDNEDLRITITGTDPEMAWGYGVLYSMENRSKDRTYSITVEDAAINGLTMDPFYSCDVEAGSTLEDAITFSSAELEKYGIGRVTDVELTLSVYDTDNWAAGEIWNGTVRICPFGEEAAVTYVRAPRDTDQVIMDNEYVTVTLVDGRMEEDKGYALDLYFVNKTDREIWFNVAGAYINDSEADPMFAADIKPGRPLYSSVWWTEDLLESEKISDVEEVTLDVQIMDAHDETASDLLFATVTFSP